MSAAEPRLDVLCVGLATLDLLAAVDRYPDADAKVDLLGLTEQGGGPAATAAVAVARLGGSAALITAVGDDPRGEAILAELASEGVDVSSSRRYPGALSRLSLVVVARSGGTRNVFDYPGGARLRAEDVDPEAVQSARVVLVDNHMADSSLRAARLAREAGIPVVLDTGTPRPGVEPLLELADYCIPPIETARQLSGREDPEEATAALHARGRAVAVVTTMGAEGYVVASAEGVRRERAFEVQAVDTTGAGDAFHGAFALALARGQPVHEAARFAAATAALKCRAPGGRTGLPGLQEVEAMLGTRPPSP